MSAYKLIKEYPGSPKLGTIREPNAFGIIAFTFDIHQAEEKKYEEFWEKVIDKNPLKLKIGKTYELQYIHCESTPFIATITRFTNDGFPWMEKMNHEGNGIVTDSYKLIREIVKKDYEILSVINPLQNNAEILENLEHNYSFEYKLNKFPHLQIKSVKRLSDNTIFTIGDFVKPKKCKHNAFTITGFTLDCNNEHILALGGNGGIRINKLNLSEKPLFKTFDNVDIFKGDKYFKVLPNSNYALWDLKASNICARTNITTFSTKEKAEEYIVFNKPCLSIKEFIESTDYILEYNGEISNKLKKLVKSKL